MAETILFAIAQEVLKNLGSKALNEIASTWGFKTQLRKLKNTIDTIKNDLLDAEERQADSHAIRSWLERLSTVVYAADDLFDEVTTVAARKELMTGCQLGKEVSVFFSNSNQVSFACKISWNIKKIRDELDDIEKDGKKFEFVRGSPERGIVMSNGRDQTMSYVDEDDVVGRDDEKKAILDMLLASSSTAHENGHEGLPVIPIVGMGGMGKTTLAQLIYNDPQVKQAFDLRLWVCVSDVFDIKAIIDKLLKSATNKETPNLEMDQLQGLLQKEVADKKYLLVLDDVWNEDRRQWLDVRNLLKIGRKGSKILLTTRSKEVADIMGTSPPYDLQGLSKEKSWELFEKMAFNNPEEAQQKPRLVEIGKEIVKKCGHVPIAIRTLGSLLYGKEERKWLSVKDTSLAKIPDDQSDIMKILRYSYNNLFSPLKNCFSYCALFPKDYEFDKEMLKDLWIAEGFIVPDANECQSQDAAAEVYFHNLLQRGFFQNIKKNEWGDITSCKMHDLMHDLAQEVSGAKSKVADFNDRDFEEKCVHLSLAFQLTSAWKIPKSMLNMKLLRTFLMLEHTKREFHSIRHELLTRFRSLRVLDISKHDIKSLPSSIGKLIHLRYLDLSHTPLKSLPDSITGLWNLQVLKLLGCCKLETFPGNMRKLINLRSLNVYQCFSLSDMPSGLGGLTALSSLPYFIVKHESTVKLSELKDLNNLRGRLFINIKSNCTMLEARTANLSNKHGLTELIISLSCHFGCNNDHEAVLEGLAPPPEIKSLSIYNYDSEKVPSWARMDNLCTTLPFLVHIELSSWMRCQQLPAFSRLPFLKRLELECITRVEYIEESNEVCGVPSSSSIFFPSLEQLYLHEMENLKGWWKEVDEGNGNENETSESESESAAQITTPTTSIQFSKLSKLSIRDCPNLRMLPLCPNVEDLTLVRTNETLEWVEVEEAINYECRRANANLSNKNGLTELIIRLPNHSDCNNDDEAVLKELKPPSEIKSLRIYYYQGENVPSWARVDTFCTTLPYLVDITLYQWKKCQQLPAFSKLPFLKRLQLYSITSVEYIESYDVCGVPSSSSSTSSLFFPSLEQLDLHKMENLKGWWNQVEGIGNESESAFNDVAAQIIPATFIQFSKLSKLSIRECPNLRMLPLCPNVEDLTLEGTNETFSVLKMATTSTSSLSSSSSSSAPSSSSTGTGLKLKKLSIGNVEELMSLPNHCLHQLSFLEVYGDDKLESTERLEDVFATLSSSLRSLEIRNCHKLRSIAKGIEHLTALKTLGLYNCSRVEAWGDEKGMPWKALSIKLRSLSFEDFPQLVGLPRGLQHLSNLHSLSLIGNHKLEEVPEWISCLSFLEYLQLWDCPKLRGLPEAFSQLSTLNHLEIIECPGLEKGCQGPNGSEWPKIKHIRFLSVRDQY